MWNWQSPSRPGDLNVLAGDLLFGFRCHSWRPSLPQLLQATSNWRQRFAQVKSSSPGVWHTSDSLTLGRHCNSIFVEGVVSLLSLLARASGVNCFETIVSEARWAWSVLDLLRHTLPLLRLLFVDLVAWVSICWTVPTARMTVTSYSFTKPHITNKICI